MTLQQFEYVLAVDRFRHFAKAAEFCRVAQPTLSAMIQKLEEELCVKIFDRKEQPVVPTLVGKKVIAQIRETTRQASFIKPIVKEHENAISGSLCIGMIPTILPFLFPRFFPSMESEHPQLHLVVNEMKTAACIDAVLNGELDAAIIASSPNDKMIKCEAIYYEQFLGYIARNEPLFAAQCIKSTDINGKRLWLLDEGHCFRDQLLRFCQLEFVLNNQNTYRLDSIETLMRLVESGKGITFIPELATEQLSPQQQELVRPFAIPSPVREITLICRTDFVRTRLLSLLVEQIKKSVPTELLTLRKERVKVI